MSDPSESLPHQPSSQQSTHTEPAHTSGLATPPPSFGDNLCVPLEEEGVGSSGSILPRNLSAISLGPEACHIEDVDDGCGHQHQKYSILHSATPTPAISRNPSRVDVTHGLAVSEPGVHEGDLLEEEEGKEGGGEDDDVDGDGDGDGVLEMKAPNINGYSENVQMNSPIGTSHSSPPPQPEAPEPASEPAASDADDERQLPEEAKHVASAPETSPVEAANVVAAAPVPDEPVEEQPAIEYEPDTVPPVSEHLNDTENIDWQFDDMSALQAHITGPDPFQQPEKEVPARSSTFPPVPPHDESLTTAHYDNEEALFDMMASEVATGDGENLIFTSPSMEQGGFLGAPVDDDAAHGDLSDSASRSETIDDNVTAMMGQVLDAARVGGLALEAEENVENGAVQFEEEEAPLVDRSHSPETTTNVSDLFGDTETEGGGDFFAGLGGGDEEFIPELEESKSTVQAAEDAIHPSHSAVSVAASVATVNSRVLDSEYLPTERKDSLFDTLPSTADGGDDFFSQIGQQPEAQEDENTAEVDDLTARWKAALAGGVLDDEDGFLPSDDEGFLPDSDDEDAPNTAAPVHGTDGQLQGFSRSSTGDIGFVQTPGPSAQQPSGRYAPQQVQPHAPPVQQSHGGNAPWQPPLQQMPLNPYAPSQPAAFSSNATQAYFHQLPTTGPYAAFAAKPLALPERKAQSFVDKKEGYQSPYDLPMDVAPSVTRRRPSNLGASTPNFSGSAGPSPPVRSSSMGAVFSQTMSIPGAQQKPKIQPQKFFEELPIAPPKPRTVSAMGMGGRYSPSPANQLPPRSAGGYVPQLTGSSRVGGTQEFYPQNLQKSFTQPAVGQPQQQQSTVGSGYSPAPRQASGAYAPPPAPTSAPAMQGYRPPSSSVPNANSPYPPATNAPPTTPPKYAPRPAGPPQMGTRPMGPSKPIEGQLSPQGIASPSQQFAQLHGFPSPGASGQGQQEDAYHIAQRRFSGDHHSMHSSRPGTARSISISTTMDVPREEEEEAVENSSVLQSNGLPLSSQNRYAPSRGTGTPTPGQISRANTFTPPPGVNRTASPETIFQPPQRAQTQSPGMVFGRNNKIAQRPRDPYERPSSAFAHTSTYSHSSLDLHQRAHSLQLNFMTPTDETGRDTLKRWQGAPVFTWGFGGNIAIMFPRRAQRYTSDMQQPMIKCSPGEVKIKNIKEILPLEEIEGKFPGPVWNGGRNRGKKKEVLAWMGTKIEALERESEGQGKRAAEKVLLWKVVRALLENDGAVEGNPEVEKVIRGVLTPEVEDGSDGGINGGFGGSFTMVGDISANMQGPSADRVDPEAVRIIKTNLLKGDRTAAVWHAADKRLWSHALLIAGTVGKDLWKQVVQEFVKHEVKTLGDGVESLAVLYEILAGNWAESVDELVSASTRVGIPMLGGAPNGCENVEGKLDRWRETLGLVLNNRSPGDAEAILALGKLLVGYGRVEAGHICYVFARQGSMGGIGAVLGGHDDPGAHFSLLGMEGGANFTPKDMDAVMLSEIYELALSLAPIAHPAFPHLLSYKLHRAMIRAENGHKAESQKYVDAIISAIKASGKPSVHINSTLMAAVEELNTRLSFAPKDSASGAAATGAGGWIPKLNSETVTSSIWETFNTFVSGEKDEAGTAADQTGIDPSVSGPFARMSSESPNMSRVQSGVDLYSAYNTTPNYGPGPQGGPGPRQYQPPGKYSRNSYESQPSPYSPVANHQRKSSADSYRPSYTSGGYEPSGNPYEPSANSYEPKPQQQQQQQHQQQQQQQQANPYDSPQPSSNSTTGFGGNANMYDSRSSFDEPQSSAPTTGYDSPADSPSYGGYEPPSSGGGYEPPSNGFRPYEPKEDNDDEENDEKTKPKPKKMGFMDDDDDEFLKKVEKSKREEEDKKKATVADPNGKKGWFGWFKKDPGIATPGPIKAKLGEESSFVYDPDLKRWINKKAGDSSPVTAKPPPPPMGRASTPVGGSTGMPSRPSSVAPPPPPPVKRASTPIGTSAGVPSRPSSVAPPLQSPMHRASTPLGASTGIPSRPASVAPPPYSEPPRASTPATIPTTPTTPGPPTTPGMLPAPPPPLGRAPSPMAMPTERSPPPSPAGSPSVPPPPGSKPPGSGPPSRPPTAMGKVGDPMDDLLGPPGANVSRKSTPAGGRKARGKSRYVEVIPGQQ